MAIRATYELEYSPPLDWAFFLRYLGVRATPGVETVENGRYIRTLATGRSAGTLCVSPMHLCVSPMHLWNEASRR
jgi:DNA-3-methyladenine glycosylase II